jgi:hypothetical protein
MSVRLPPLRKQRGAQTIEGGIGRGNQELRPRQPARIGFVTLYPVAVSAIVFADVVVVVAAFEPSLSRQQPRARQAGAGGGVPPGNRNRNLASPGWLAKNGFGVALFEEM